MKKLPEAVAMKEYAVAQGVPEGEILVETNSTTTYENMKFSKEIMDSLKPNGYKVIFSSNNYHIFRAGLYADQAQLKADGIGAPTAFYYLPNAFLREFVAILFMHKKTTLNGIDHLADPLCRCSDPPTYFWLSKQKKFFEPAGSKNFFLLHRTMFLPETLLPFFFHTFCKWF